MKDDLLKQAVRKSCHRVTKDEVIERNRSMFAQLALDDDDLQRMANEVGLELEDLLLIQPSGFAHIRSQVAKLGSPGRKNETQDIADFANARLPRMTWDQIHQDWLRSYPNDKRVVSKETIREAWRRHYGDKSKARKRASKKP